MPPFNQKGPKYAPLPGLDTGSARDGSSESFDLEQKDQSPGPHIPGESKHPIRVRPILAFITGILLGLFAGILGLHVFQTRETATSDEVGDAQFVPPMGTKTVTFEAIPELTQIPSPGNQLYWDSLFPPGHGFINITQPEKYGLPHGVRTHGGPDQYSISMFHQLHCLAMIRQSHFNLTQIVLTDAERNNSRAADAAREELSFSHTQHCFAYLAQAILCAGDMTVEWARVLKGARRDVDGWGVPHVCKDRDQIMEFMEQHHGAVGHRHAQE